MNPLQRILFAALSTITVLVLLFGYRTSLSGPDLLAAGTPTPVVGAVSTTDPTTTSADPATGAVSDTATRTVTGPAAQTRYGPVQVELTVSGTGAAVSIADVAVIQYPHSSGRDVEINGYALPRLIQATLDQQSAGVDMVSGATYTSEGYRTSLQAALDQAQA